MGWHSRSPSVIKHRTAVTLLHPRQTGWDNEPLPWAPCRVLSPEEGAATGRGRCGQGCHARGRAAGPGLRAVPDHPLQTALLNSAGRGFAHICWATWHLVQTGRVGHFHLLSSVLFEIA